MGRQRTGSMRPRKRGTWELSVSAGVENAYQRARERMFWDSSEHGGIMLETEKDQWKLGCPILSEMVKGKRRRITETFKGSKADAQKRLREMVYEADKGLYEPTGYILLEWIASDLATQKRRKAWATNTIRNYEGLIRNHIQHDLGLMTLAEIGPVHIIEFMGRLQERMTAESAVVVYRYLKGVFNRAMEAELIPKSPMIKGAKPKVDKKPVTCPSEMEMGDILAEAQANDPDYYPIFLLTAHTGLRVAELLGMRWQDVDILGVQHPGPTIEVNRQQVNVKGGYVYDKPKSKSSVRAIPLSQEAADALLVHRTAQDAHRDAVGPTWDAEKGWGGCSPVPRTEGRSAPNW